MVNIYIAYDLILWPFTVGKDFTLVISLFGAVKLKAPCGVNVI